MNGIAYIIYTLHALGKKTENADTKHAPQAKRLNLSAELKFTRAAYCIFKNLSWFCLEHISLLFIGFLQHLHYCNIILLDD